MIRIAKVVGIAAVVLLVISVFLPSLNKDGAVPRTIYVTVTDAATGRPVRGAEFMLLRYDDGTPMHFGTTSPTDTSGKGSLMAMAGYGSETGIIGSWGEHIDCEFICTAAGYESKRQSVQASHRRRTMFGLKWPIPPYRASVSLQRASATAPSVPATTSRSP